MANSDFNKIIPTARIILSEYDLCDNCLGRLFVKNLDLKSSKFLGKKIHLKIHKKTAKCYICKNLLSNINYYIEKMLEQSSDFQFSNFLIGAILKPSVIDRDDLIRSKFKLVGIDSIKTEITKELGKIFSQKTKTVIEHINPDLTFTINFKNDSVEIRSKSLVLYGRYLKKSRTLSQKQKSCKQCKGTGCLSCNYHGISSFDSIEGTIAQFLYEKFGALQTKFSWIGGEDKTSLVLGKGRPFFVKIVNPHKRNIQLPKSIYLDQITILNLKQIPQIPKNPTRFRSKIQLKISTKNEIKSINLKNLKKLNKNPIFIYEKPGIPNKKSLYSINYKKISSHSLLLQIIADGGLPIKRFVAGDTVFPNLSEVLETPSMCKEFDFLEIELE